MRMLPRGLAILFVLGILGLLFLMPFSLAEPARERSYGQFVQDVSRGDVQEVVVSDRSLTAAYRGGERVLVYLPRDPAALLGVLLAEGVGVEFRRVGDGGGWGALFPIVLPLLLLGGLIWFMTGQGAGGGAGQVYSFGQSRAELYTPGEKRVTMRDVAGMPEVKEELAEVVDFLQSPERYRELGARIPKGVLLSGPPGTGKTLLARAVAGEAGVPFYAISGSDFVEIFAGVGAARVRDLFARARQNVPCIIFVDEIDAVGRRRGQSIGGGNDEREQTLNQLLVEMDGFGNHEGIIVVAATNRLDILDTAILRPGRFDRQIVVDPPDRQGRREILAVHALGKPLADDVDLDLIAGMTVGFTGADLANLLNEAALLAARRRKVHVGMTDIQAAQERAVAGGPSLRRTMAEAERVRVAVHEAGHVVVSRQLPGADPIAKVTITPRGRAQGYVMYRPMEDKNLYTRAEILDRIVSLLGGRAAEQLALGDVSTGAADDLERATGLARRMVAELGMSPEIGPVAVASGQGAVMAGSGRLPSNRTVSTVDSGVSQLVHEAYGRALALLCQQRQALDLVARALLERETLEGRELEELLAAY